MTRHAETRYVDDWNVRRDGPTVFLDLYPPGATAADPPACSIALNRIAAENIGRNLQWAGQGVTTPPTPPRPEPVATDVLAERARGAARHAAEWGTGTNAPLLTALAERLAESDRRIAELEAGLRALGDEADRAVLDLSRDAVIGAPFVARIARDLLAGRAAGGEG